MLNGVLKDESCKTYMGPHVCTSMAVVARGGYVLACNQCFCDQIAELESLTMYEHYTRPVLHCPAEIKVRIDFA